MDAVKLHKTSQLVDQLNQESCHTRRCHPLRAATCVRSEENFTTRHQQKTYSPNYAWRYVTVRPLLDIHISTIYQQLYRFWKQLKSPPFTIDSPTANVYYMVVAKYGLVSWSTRRNTEVKLKELTWKLTWLQHPVASTKLCFWMFLDGKWCYQMFWLRNHLAIYPHHPHPTQSSRLPNRQW